MEKTCLHLDGNGTSFSVGEREEAEEMCKGSVGTIEKSRHFGLEDKHFIQCCKMADEEEPMKLHPITVVNFRR